MTQQATITTRLCRAAAMLLLPLAAVPAAAQPASIAQQQVQQDMHRVFNPSHPAYAGRPGSGGKAGGQGGGVGYAYDAYYGPTYIALVLGTEYAWGGGTHPMATITWSPPKLSAYEAQSYATDECRRKNQGRDCQTVVVFSRACNALAMGRVKQAPTRWRFYTAALNPEERQRVADGNDLYPPTLDTLDDYVAAAEANVLKRCQSDPAVDAKSCQLPERKSDPYDDGKGRCATMIDIR